MRFAAFFQSSTVTYISKFFNYVESRFGRVYPRKKKLINIFLHAFGNYLYISRIVEGKPVPSVNRHSISNISTIYIPGAG